MLPAIALGKARSQASRPPEGHEQPSRPAPEAEANAEFSAPAGAAGDPEPPRPEDSEEHRLAARIEAGDEGAFGELVDLHLSRVHSIIKRLIRDRSAAEDVTQEVFFKVHRKLHTWRRDAAFSTWIYRVAVNASRDWMKRHRADRTPTLLDEIGTAALSAETADPVAEAERQDLRARVREAMDALPDIFRTILVLRELEGLSYEEIGSILDCPKGTVESRLFRARAKVKAILERDGQILPGEDS